METTGASAFVFFEQWIYVYFIQYFINHSYRMFCRNQFIQRGWNSHGLVLLIYLKSYAAYTSGHIDKTNYLSISLHKHYVKLIYTTLCINPPVFVKIKKRRLVLRQPLFLYTTFIEINDTVLNGEFLN